jgi:hypothetical protein
VGMMRTLVAAEISGPAFCVSPQPPGLRRGLPPTCARR